MKVIRINRKWCKQCGICMSFCVKKVFEEDEDRYPTAAHPELCINCKLCEKRCPEFAITVED